MLLGASGMLQGIAETLQGIDEILQGIDQLLQGVGDTLLSEKATRLAVMSFVKTSYGVFFLKVEKSPRSLRTPR